VIVRRRGVSEGQFGRGGVVGLVVGGLDLRASLLDEFQRILVGAGAWHGETSAFGSESAFTRINGYSNNVDTSVIELNTLVRR
jgi:hypothetical protein